APRPLNCPGTAGTGTSPVRAHTAARSGRAPTDTRSATTSRGKPMTQTFAAEGGYQIFTLGSSEWFWLIFSMAVAAIALIAGYFMMQGVLSKQTGTAEMEEIASAVQEGAMAYIKRQF